MYFSVYLTAHTFAPNNLSTAAKRSSSGASFVLLSAMRVSAMPGNTSVKVVLHAPAQARAFQPGQFFRLQNYEMLAARVSEIGRAHV